MVRSPHRPRRIALVAALAGLTLAACALAQPRVSGEIRQVHGAAWTAAGETVRFGVTPSYALRLDLGWDVGPVALAAVLDPVASAPPGSVVPQASPGLAEAYLSWRGVTLDVSAGLERLPLETARLSLPLSLEPVDAFGRPRGLLGARARVYLGEWRLRGALLLRDPWGDDLRDLGGARTGGWPVVWGDADLGGLASLRYDALALTAELHLGYLGRGVAGLGLSTTTEALVLYGEGWLLWTPDDGSLDGRGAAGVSGFAGDALWTAEAGWLPGPAGDPARPQLAASLDLPLVDDWSLRLLVQGALPESLPSSDERRLEWLASAAVTANQIDYALSLTPSVADGEFGTRYGLELAFTSFF